MNQLFVCMLLLFSFMPSTVWSQLLREDVIEMKDGSRLRGEIQGTANEKEACRRKKPDSRCKIRIAGGSVFVYPTEKVKRVFRARKYKSHLGHHGQFGLSFQFGLGVGIDFRDGIGFAFAIPGKAAITYGITNALEISVGYLGLPSFGTSFHEQQPDQEGTSTTSHYGIIDFRYFYNARDAIKLYTSGGIFGGMGVGVRTASGVQIDFSRKFGLFLEQDFYFGWDMVGTRKGVYLLWGAQLGLQGRF